MKREIFIVVVICLMAVGCGIGPTPDPEPIDKPDPVVQPEGNGVDDMFEESEDMQPPSIPE